MPVENASYIAELDPSYPTGDESQKFGDDYIRLIKKVLLQTFPFLAGPVTANEKHLSESLSRLDPTTGNLLNFFHARSRKIAFVANPDGASDATPKSYVDGKITEQVEAAVAAAKSSLYAVGHVLITKNEANPATYLGFGTWARTGHGRVLLGAGTMTDGAGTERTYTAGTTGGRVKVGLTAANLPAGEYVTEAFPTGTPENGETKQLQFQSGGQAIQNNKVQGQGETFDIMQPYAVVYFWERTA